MLQMREGLDLVERDLADISHSLAGLARKYRDTPIIGRSNLEQATPITFGYRIVKAGKLQVFTSCDLFAQSGTEEKLVATGETLLTVVKASDVT